MARSLRWRLQIWHAAILVLAIAGFSGVLFLQFQRSLLREIDAELLAGARALEGTLKLAPRFILEAGFPDGPLDRPLGRGGAGRGPGPGGARGQVERSGGESPTGERSGGERGAGDRDSEPGESRKANSPGPSFGPGGVERAGRPGGPGRPRPLTPEQWMELLTLPRELPVGRDFAPPPGTPGGRLGEARRPPARPFPSQPSYYSVFAANGSLLKSELASGQEPIPFVRPRNPVEYRNRDYRRELVLKGPDNSVVIVGQDVRPQFDQIQWLGTRLLAIGLGVLALGLFGGWWLAGRAIRPLEQISETARGIEASKLAERFNVESADAELRELGQTLNSMLARLEAGFEQQNRFAADASHELRTPLAVLLSHTELALARQRSPDEYQAALQTIHRSGERMKGLVEDLLVLARVNSGRLDLRRERTDLRQLAEESAQLLRPLADAAGVELRVVGESVFAEIDSSRMGQALVNLIANAIKYNRPQGSVSVEVEQTADAVVLRVSDTGVGIPVESLPHLFEPFYRVDADRSRETGGSGLGLAISRRLVNAHGGEITVHSERGVGSRFEIRLPAVNELEGKSNLAVDD